MQSRNILALPKKNHDDMADNSKTLTPDQQAALFATLKTRFQKNMNRHAGLDWAKVQARLEAHSDKLWSLYLMEETGGEPDVVGYDERTGGYLFYDCAAESPKGRRSLCYDRAAWESRKEFKPADNAVDVAQSYGLRAIE